MTIRRRLRSLAWITSGFFKKRKRILFASGLIGVVGFLFITQILPVLPQPKPTVRIGMVGRYTWETLPEPIYQQVGKGLTAVLPDGSVVPSLSEKWEVSDKGQVYTFTLRENLTWQDGEPLRASDLRYPFTDVEVTAPNERTVEFRLKEPFAPFPTIVRIPVFKDKLKGTGPYQIKAIKQQGEVIERIILSGQQRNLVYRFYPTLTLAVQGFKLGEVDTLQDVFEVPLSQDWQEKVEVEKRTRTDQYVGLFFNLKHPLLGDKSARQALGYATKKDFGGLKRAVGPISPDSWAFNPDVKTYDFDADRAKELFDSLFIQGAEATESAVPLPNQADVNLTISATPSLLPIAEAIKSNWEEVLGIRVQVTATNTVSPDFEVLLIGQEIFPDPDQYPLWHSTQPQNLTHYQSPKVDKLLEDARQILDQAKRKERYLDFQRFLVEDSPVVFLYHPETFTISRRSAAAK